MEFSTFSLSSSHIEEFEQIAKECNATSGYKWLPSSRIPSAIPESLRKQMTSALLMWEPTSSGSVYLVVNGIRHDQKDNALDQEPFGIVVEEAMSIGLPLVVYKSGGGYVEILNSKNGVIIDNLNDLYWGNQINKLLKNAKKIKSYSDYNQMYVQKNYDQQNMNTNIWSLINSL